MDANLINTQHSSPCESFDAWATHSDTRIASTGVKLRIRWCETALTVPILVPLTSFVMRGVREKWPEPGAANATLANLADVATYIHTLEARIAVYEGVSE